MFFNSISYITIASTGNATDFGDLVGQNAYLSSTSSPIRGVFCCGYTNADGRLNVLQYVTIASTGNAIDFGDAINSISASAATSSNNGGLQ